MKTIGCTEQNFWGRREFKTQWCDQCCVSYDSHCICQGAGFIKDYDRNDILLLNKFSEWCNRAGVNYEYINKTPEELVEKFIESNPANGFVFRTIVDFKQTGNTWEVYSKAITRTRPVKEAGNDKVYQPQKGYLTVSFTTTHYPASVNESITKAKIILGDWLHKNRTGEVVI